MANPKIKFKRSAVAGKRPTLSGLELGELALNTYDGKLFTRRDTSGVGIATTISIINPWTENFGATQIEYDGDVSIVGVLTVGSSSVVIDGSNNNVKVGSGITVSETSVDVGGGVTHGGATLHSQGFRVGSSDLHSDGLNVNYLQAKNIFATGVTTSIGGFFLRNPSSESFDNTSDTFDDNGTPTFDSAPISASIFADGAAKFTGIVTAPGFVGDLTGDVTGNADTATSATTATNAQGLTGTPNITVGDVNADTLLVTGITTISGLRYPQADGTANQVLITDGAGNLGFADQSGSSSGSPGVTTTSSTGQVSIDSIAKITYSAAIYKVQVTSETAVHFTNVNIVHDGSLAYVNEFGTIQTGPGLSTFSARINGSNLELLAYPASSATTVFNLDRTLIATGAASVTSTTTTSTSETSILNLAKDTYKAGVLEIQVTRGSAAHFTTVSFVHNGTTVSITEVGVIKTGASLASFTMNISGTTLQLLATPSSASSTTFKVLQTTF
tara:strand:+ start:19153 stop:20655 length:1503 start_codon:yes stop_codon:yes gene_type:complete